MKLKRVAICTLLLVMLIGGIVYAKDDNNPILIGKITEVKTSENNKDVRILVDGVIKSTDVYKETVLVIISDETSVLDKGGNKLIKTDLKKGDGVVIVLSPEMTKSIPPQSVAKKIEVYKIKD